MCAFKSCVWGLEVDRVVWVGGVDLRAMQKVSSSGSAARRGWRGVSRGWWGVSGGEG